MTTDSEYRRDPLTRRWVVVSENRAERPSNVARTGADESPVVCPFCPGQESKTPPEIVAVRPTGGAPDSPGWSVRVVPNKFPALTSDSELRELSVGPYQKRGGHGVHEVIIVHPDHDRRFSRLSVDEFSVVLNVSFQRLRIHAENGRLRHAVLFANVGSRSGASLSHPHFQLIAGSVVPKRISDDLVNAEEYDAKHGESYFEKLIEYELSESKRVIAETDAFLAFAPYASRFPFEVWIVPRSAGACVRLLDDDRCRELAELLHRILGCFDLLLGEPDFNFVFVCAPFDYDDGNGYRWRVELIPRLNSIAGYELGAGCFINPTSPENAAKLLRESWINA